MTATGSGHLGGFHLFQVRRNGGRLRRSQLTNDDMHRETCLRARNANCMPLVAAGGCGPCPFGSLSSPTAALSTSPRTLSGEKSTRSSSVQMRTLLRGCPGSVRLHQPCGPIVTHLHPDLDAFVAVGYHHHHSHPRSDPGCGPVLPRNRHPPCHVQRQQRHPRARTAVARRGRC